MKALEPEIEEFKPAKKETKKSTKRGPKREEVELPSQEEEKEQELTAMQIAWQEALHKEDQTPEIQHLSGTGRSARTDDEKASPHRGIRKSVMKE
jgi:hypothetical protein